MLERESSLTHIDMLALPAITLKGPMALPIKVGQIKPDCDLDHEGTVIQAMNALRWAYAGIPLCVYVRANWAFRRALLQAHGSSAHSLQERC